MEIKNTDGMLKITTEVYQIKKGAIVMNWGIDFIVLNRDKADLVAYDIKDFDIDLYNKFYLPIKD